MNEADLRLKLIEVHKAFHLALVEVAREITNSAFDETVPREERSSLEKLLKEIADDLDKNRQRMEEILLSDGPILKVVNPKKIQ